MSAEAPTWLVLGPQRPVRNLGDAVAAAGQLGGYLRFESEAPLADLQAVEHVGPEGFVAGLHVRQVQVCKHIGQKGQEFVADIVPEKEYPVGSS